MQKIWSRIYKLVNHGKNSEYFIISDSIPDKHNSFLGQFLHGVKLKSYEFKKYKQKKKQELF